MESSMNAKKNMRINWGTSIVIAFILFASFILYFIIKVETNSKYENELVVEEYYKHDAHFGDEMVKIQNAHDLVEKPSIINTAEGITVHFPSALDINKIKGKVSFYRPSNKKLDFEVPISLSSPTLLIPKLKLVGGLWDISLFWSYEGKEFISKEKIYFK
jgi:hypothetical protein